MGIFGEAERLRGQDRPDCVVLVVARYDAARSVCASSQIRRRLTNQAIAENWDSSGSAEQGFVTPAGKHYSATSLKRILGEGGSKSRALKHVVAESLEARTFKAAPSNFVVIDKFRKSAGKLRNDESDVVVYLDPWLRKLVKEVVAQLQGGARLSLVEKLYQRLCPI